MRWRWLLVLPVALALVLVASASRLQVFWWPEQLHDVTTGVRGEPVEVRDGYVDADGVDRVRELTLTLEDVAPATTFEGFSGREPIDRVTGSAVWEVRLAVEVDPGVPLGGCEVVLVDTEGRETEATSTVLGDSSLPGPACEPEERPGPGYDGSVPEDSPPRPASYDVVVLVVTAADVEPAAVRVWWEAPDVTEIRLAR